MKAHHDRLITKVYDPMVRDFINVAKQLDGIDEGEFFRRRRQIEEGTRTYLCSVCYQPLVLRGTPSRVIYHYSHRLSSEDCPLQEKYKLKAEEVLAMKFNGQKEGAPHRNAKGFIYDAIVADSHKRFSEARMEPTFRDKNPNNVMTKAWRRPDVSTLYTVDGKTRNVVFELQMSSTFISVIVAREEFYQRNNTFVVWVLLEFDGQRYTDLDIAYGNRVNVFVLSDDAKNLTHETGELWFEVHWREPELVGDEIQYDWKNELIPFSKIIFHDYYMKAYFNDVETKEGELKAKLQDKKRDYYEEYCSFCRESTPSKHVANSKLCSNCMSPK